MCSSENSNLQWGGFCGFDGWPVSAYGQKDLALFMQLHADHGEQYTNPGFHSGYNEAIVSAEKMNAALPAAVA